MALVSNMVFPSRIPFLRAATVLLAIYALVWTGLEGDVRRVTILGVWATIVLALTLLQRVLGGKRLSLPAWLGLAAAIGAIAGAVAVLLTLFLMALKTGLHAHGPEFSPAEVAWLWAQLPVWTGAGAALGLGLGLIAAALTKNP